MYINTSGLVLRETKYKDSSKILTVLTAHEGKLTVLVRGALRKNSKLAAVSQLLAYSDMTLFQSRDRWTMTEAQSVEQFTGLREDIELLALGSYFAELTEAVSDEDSPNPEILSLCLNALFALSEGKKAPGHIKPAFELRLMAAAGFAPLLDHCSACGETEPESVLLDLSGGTLCCSDCRPERVGTAALGRGALSAARYIAACDRKKLFSFTLSPAAQRELSNAAEAYLHAQLDRRFQTLEFYKSVTAI